MDKMTEVAALLQILKASSEFQSVDMTNICTAATARLQKINQEFGVDGFGEVPEVAKVKPSEKPLEPEKPPEPATISTTPVDIPRPEPVTQTTPVAAERANRNGTP